MVDSESADSSSELEEAWSESESEEPEPPTAPTPVAEKKPPPKNPDLATVPQSSYPGCEEEVDGEEAWSESESEEPEPPTAPTPVAEKKPPPKNPDLATVPQSSYPGSEEEVDREEEEESGSESEEPEPALAGKKPPPKKPDSAMEETPKTKKPRSKASATTTQAARAGSKRPSESDPKYSKRPKKKKPLLLQRIWSDDDEITILEGMIGYYTKQGVHPNADMFAFHDFMKKSLKADVNKTQLQDKIRRLKKKYETNVVKGKKYVKPHELKVFELSKRVWGSGEGSEQYKCETCAGLREMRLIEDCLGLIEETKRSELKEAWNKLNIAELEMVVRRGELAKLTLEAMK